MLPYKDMYEKTQAEHLLGNIPTMVCLMLSPWASVCHMYKSLLIAKPCTNDFCCGT